MRWVEIYQEEGEIKRHNRDPIAYKVKISHVEFIKKEIHSNKTITMEDLLIKDNKEFPELRIYVIM